MMHPQGGVHDRWAHGKLVELCWATQTRRGLVAMMRRCEVLQFVPCQNKCTAGPFLDSPSTESAGGVRHLQRHHGFHKESRGVLFCIMIVGYRLFHLGCGCFQKTIHKKQTFWKLNIQSLGKFTLKPEKNMKLSRQTKC